MVDLLVSTINDLLLQIMISMIIIILLVLVLLLVLYVNIHLVMTQISNIKYQPINKTININTFFNNISQLTIDIILNHGSKLLLTTDSNNSYIFERKRPIVDFSHHLINHLPYSAVIITIHQSIVQINQ